jgi:hypothetical protein
MNLQPQHKEEEFKKPMNQKDSSNEVENVKA